MKIDDELESDRWMGRPPWLTDSDLVTLAVAQAPLGLHSETRRLRYANAHLGAMFPHLPQRPSATEYIGLDRLGSAT
ncbi:hypothetical protein ABZ876_30905 [Streptomyces sp. NPDC046931]|uniref:hypothetical protein n=1 Tax=Streptomyces sp. NPDC046931 TaxID=3154806 RepID=UPI0033DD4E91